MAREKKRKGRSAKGTEGKESPDTVHLVPAVEWLHSHITEALCNEVFQDVRTTERDRKWSLFALARFWEVVVLEPPPSLTQLLERSRLGDPRGSLPVVSASAEAFFQKCKAFSSGFFMAIYHRFVEAVLPEAPPFYCGKVARLRKRFAEVNIIDGSRLDKIAHRLKILWPQEAAILPGCLTAVYDLYRGIAHQLWFDADAAASEFDRGMLAIECLVEGTLLLGDRLYCNLQMFSALNRQHCFGVFRRNRTVSIQKVRRLSRLERKGRVIEDWLVRAGIGKDALDLRLVTLKANGNTYEALTNVLDPKRLSAREVVDLYPLRWHIERLFYDLKEVLNLHKFYAANPNAVAMQVYAAAMVHVAFRIAQAKIAAQACIEPEKISPKKLFPHLALVSMRLIAAEHYFAATVRANPGVTLRKPSWKDLPDSIVSLRRILVQRRSDVRRKREFSKERKKWKSLKHIRGGEELT
jgi:DDE family transposase